MASAGFESGAVLWARSLTLFTIFFYGRMHGGTSPWTSPSRDRGDAERGGLDEGGGVIRPKALRTGGRVVADEVVDGGLVVSPPPLPPRPSGKLLA